MTKIQNPTSRGRAHSASRCHSLASFWPALCVCAAVGSGCGSGDARLVEGSPSELAPSETVPGDFAASYAISSRVYGADLSSPTSFLWLVDNLDEGSLSVADAIELP